MSITAGEVCRMYRDAIEDLQDRRFAKMARIIGQYAEKENKLMMLSGCDMELLIERLAEGWTLQPPDTRLYSMSLAEALGEGD